jgi:hypothetical protein
VQVWFRCCKLGSSNTHSAACSSECACDSMGTEELKVCRSAEHKYALHSPCSRFQGIERWRVSPVAAQRTSTAHTQSRDCMHCGHDAADSAQSMVITHAVTVWAEKLCDCCCELCAALSCPAPCMHVISGRRACTTRCER